MRSYLAAFVIAALVAGALTPLVRRLALRFGVLSATGGRHVGEQRVPRLGGLAIVLALFLPIVGLFFVESVVAALFQQEAKRVFGLCFGGVVMCVVGVIDDTRGLRALHKLLAQVLVASVAFAVGFRIEAVLLPVVGELSMGVFALPVTVLWIVGITNAVNLIDGLDGLAAGVVFFAALTNFVVAFIAGAGFPALVNAAVLGAVLGFLFYNFNPARIFMGDSGSYVLGYVLAATALVGAAQRASTAVSLLVPIVALGVPIFDTLFAMVRRYLERRPLFSPDRGHLHHRLLDVGITHRRAVLLIYGVCVSLTVAAIAIYLGRAWQVGVALLAASVIMVGMARFVGSFSQRHLMSRQEARFRSRDSEMLRYVIPEVSALLAAPSTEEGVLDALRAIAERAELVAVTVRRDGVTEPVLAWSDGGTERRRVVASMSYPIGRDALANATVELTTVNDYEEATVLPGTEILLQVLVDVLAQNLARVGSDLAPRVSRLPEADGEPALGTEATTEVEG